MKKTFAVVLFLMLSFSLFAGPIDSQWRGDNRDGIYTGEKLLKSWPPEGPKMIWKADGLGVGFSSAAVTKDLVLITGMIDGSGILLAFNHQGKQLWKANYGHEWDDARNFPGARTTPTVVGDRIYLTTGYGVAHCYDLNGKQIWSMDFANKYKAIRPRWSMTESLLVDGDHVYCSVGGPEVAVVVLNRHTGQVIRTVKGNGEATAYCSPLLVTYHGKQIVATMTSKSVIGFGADSDKLMWSKPHVTDWDVNANTPIYKDGYLFTFSGYGTGGQMFKLSADGTQIEKIWAQDKLDSQMGAAILINGYLYGSGQNNRAWHCVDWKTGELKYSTKALGNKGNIIFSDGLAYVYSEKGDVGLVKVSPQAFDVISSFKVKLGSGQHWAHLVIKDGRLYVRHGDVLMVYDIAAK